MAAAWPFVGRQEELVLIAEAMRDQDVGGLVLAGPAGVGKTRLAHEALAVADPDRCTTRRAVATEATRPIPFGALAPLLPAELPAASSRVNLLRLAADALVGAAGRRRLVLGVDDAHLLDSLSAALVHQLAGGAAAFMLVVVRSGEPAPEPVTALWRSRLVERVDVQELLRPDVERVLAERLGGPVDGMLAERLWQESQGNPLMLRELVTAGEQAQALRCVEGVWHWHGQWVLAPRLVELIEQRLGQLGPSERDLLELLAYAEPVGPDLLARLVSPEAVEAAEAKALCWAEQSGRRMLVHLAHPLYGEVLRARAPVLRARRHQRQLASEFERVGARRTDDALRIATWRLASGTTTAPDVLLAAARRAWALLDVELAERLARAALEAGGGWPAGEIMWRVLMLQHRNHEAERLLAGLADDTMSGQQRGELAAARAYNLFWGLDQVESGLAVIHQALAEKITDSALQARLQATQAEMLAHTCQYQHAARRAADLVARPGIQGTPLAQSHHVTGLTRLVHGQATQAAASFGQAAATPGWAESEPWLGVAVSVWHCQALLLAGRFADAAATAEASYQRALASGWDFAFGLALIERGQVCRACGQLRQSLRWLREGLGLVRDTRTSGYLFGSVLLGELAHTAALLADHATAQHALAESDATRRPSLAIYHPWADLARPWVSAAAGDHAAAVSLALEAAAAARQQGTPAYELVALHDASRLGAASAVAGRLRELGHDHPSALIRCYAGHAATLAQRDAPGLEQVSAQLEGIGAHLLAAEAAAEASRVFRLAGRADSARRTATRAAALAARCEGAATPSLQALRAPDLTQREWAIIRLAADGLTDEDIAERLTVSIRTVHNHLYHAYTKLGIHSRSGLASVLPAQPHPPGQHPPPARGQR
jgi:DNA-binding NarL/FixJ family response regulator